MVLFRDMLIDTPYRLIDIEDRGNDDDPRTRECTYCRRTRGWGHPHLVNDIVVVRRWREHSYWDPESGQLGGGGWYSWRCPEHPFNGNSSPYAANAPAHLVPEHRERCEEMQLRMRCTSMTSERFDGRWLCPEHSASVVARLRVEDRLREMEEDCKEASDR